jgi:hypothetical protein
LKHCPAQLLLLWLGLGLSLQQRPVLLLLPLLLPLLLLRALAYLQVLLRVPWRKLPCRCVQQQQWQQRSRWRLLLLQLLHPAGRTAAL